MATLLLKLRDDGTFIQLGGLLGPGFGPGLDNKGVEPESMVSEPESRS